MILEPQLTYRVSWLDRLLGRLGRRYWIRRIDRVLADAKENGCVSSVLLYDLDARLKYYPTKRFDDPRKHRVPFGPAGELTPGTNAKGGADGS